MYQGGDGSSQDLCDGFDSHGVHNVRPDQSAATKAETGLGVATLAESFREMFQNIEWPKIVIDSGRQYGFLAQLVEHLSG